MSFDKRVRFRVSCATCDLSDACSSLHAAPIIIGNGGGARAPAVVAAPNKTPLVMQHMPEPTTRSMATTAPNADSSHVVRWLRHPLSIRMLADWPHLASLFQPDFVGRVRDAVGEDGQSASPPLRMYTRGKTYFYPGCPRDLFGFFSAVVASLPDIARRLLPRTDEWDYGPPFVADMSRGEAGQWPRMWFYWNLMEKAVVARRGQRDVVVHGDVRGCYGSLDRVRMVALLSDAGSHADAVRRIDRFLSSWETAGCRGLPLVYVSQPLVKLYLREADARLIAAGVRFVRVGDDYRLICSSMADAHDAIAVFRDALSHCGLEESVHKRWVEHPGTAASAFHRQIRIWPDRLKRGVIKPLLADSLQYRVMQPISLRMIQFFTLPCRPVFVGNAPSPPPSS